MKISKLHVILSFKILLSVKNIILVKHIIFVSLPALITVLLQDEGPCPCPCPVLILVLQEQGLLVFGVVRYLGVAGPSLSSSLDSSAVERGHLER